MTKSNLTAPRIAAMGCHPGRYQTIHWDAKTPGLGVRVTAGGAKSYIFETRLHGHTLRMTIGDRATLSIKAAQARATELKALTDKGIDPRQVERQLAREAEEAKAKAIADRVRGALLVGEAYTAYLEHHRKRWGQRHLMDHENLAHPGGKVKKRGSGKTAVGVIKPLLTMRMIDVTSSALIAWQLREAVDRPTTARRGFEAIRAFWRWCASRTEYRQSMDPSAVEDKDLREQVPSRNARPFDVLERSQLRTWFKAVRALPNPVTSAYLQALLLTGARREEMSALRWEDVDLRWNSLWVKDKVEKDGRKIPLTPYLHSVLAALPRGNEWVFSSPRAKSGHVAEPRLAHNRCLATAGLDHLTLHGLRRTFASLAEWVEMPTGLVAQIMGHKPSATAERHYKRRSLDLLAVWHNKYEAWILEQAEVPYSSATCDRPLKIVR